MASIGSKEDIAASSIQQLLKQDWFEPETLKKYIQALRRFPHQDPISVEGISEPVPRATIERDVLRFNTSLGSFSIQNLSLGNLQQLTLLEDRLVTVAGLAPTSPAANIPTNLKELVAAHEASLEAQATRAKPGTDLSTIFSHRREQQAFITELNQIRNAARARLFDAASRSRYVEDLATATGVRREYIEGMLKQRIDEIVDQAITTQAFRQAQLLTQDPQQLATYFTKQLETNVKKEGDLLFTALQTNKKETKEALKQIESDVKDETAKAKAQVETVAKDISEHPANLDAAKKQAAEAIEKVELQNLSPKQRERLATELALHAGDERTQLRIVASTFRGTTGDQHREVLGKIGPLVEVLSRSSKIPSPIELANPTSILSDVRAHPEWFPTSFVRAVQSGKFSDPVVAAKIFDVSRILGISPDAALLSLGGVDAMRVAQGATKGRRILLLPTIPRLSETHPLIGKLLNLHAEQEALSNAVKNQQLPVPLLRSFAPVAQSSRRNINVSETFRNLNPINYFQAIQFNIGRIRPIGRIGSSVSSFFSGLRVRSGVVHSVFHGFGRISQGFQSLIRLPLAPFRAMGGLVSRGWGGVKSWAGVKIRSGLSKVGSWLAKKGFTTAAKKLGETALAKGTVLLLEQAIPVIGQVVAAVQIGGDILSFLWGQRENVAKIGLGLFVGAQLLLRGLLGAIGSAAWGLAGGLIGGIGGFFLSGGSAAGAFIGGGVGALGGLWIGSGGLAGFLSGLGGAIGSAASWAGGLMGALTAPSLVAGMGTTVAAMGIGGVALGWGITTFFVNPTINAGLFVPGLGRGVSAPEQIGLTMANEVPVDSNCTHAACRIQRSLESCGIRAVTRANVSTVMTCLSAFQDSTRQIINNSATNLLSLQCVGFKYAAENEEGIGFFSRNALMYLRDRPSNCAPVTNLDAIQVGDNAVWGPGGACPSTNLNTADSLCTSGSVSCCGHIAAVTRVGEGVDMDVTQAWGESGIVNTIRTTKSAPALIMHCTP